MYLHKCHISMINTHESNHGEITVTVLRLLSKLNPKQRHRKQNNSINLLVFKKPLHVSTLFRSFRVASLVAYLVGW